MIRILFTLCFLPMLVWLAEFLTFNKQYVQSTNQCRQSHFLNLTSEVPHTLIINVEPTSGQLKIFEKFHSTTEILSTQKSEWVPAGDKDTQIQGLSKSYEGTGRLENNQYMSITIVNVKCEQSYPLEYNLITTYRFSEMKVGDKLTVKIPRYSFYFALISESECQSQTSYLTVSGIAQENPIQTLNFFVINDKDIIPRNARHTFASYYANHIQIKSGAGQCVKKTNFAVWNYENEDLTVDIQVQSFSINDQHKLIPAGAMYSDFSQHTASQTYIFFNWSSQKTISIKWRSHGQARIFVVSALSEEEAKSITQVQGKIGAVSKDNFGGDQQILIGPQDELYCSYCYYVIEIQKENEEYQLLYSILVTYGNVMEELRLNSPVKRKITGGKQWYLFQAVLAQDYKITVTNNANNVEFAVVPDCRKDQNFGGFLFPRASGNSGTAILSIKKKELDDYFCLEIKVNEQYEELETYIEVSTMHNLYSLLLNGHESHLHYALSQNQHLRYFALPLGNGTHLNADTIDVDLFLYKPNHSESEPSSFCARLVGGFADLSLIDEKTDLQNLEYLEKQEKWRWCYDQQLWHPYRFMIESEELAKFENAGLFFKLEINYDGEYQALNLDLVASYNAVINLVPNADYANKLLESEDTFDLYHLHIPKGLYASVKVMPCFGAVKLEVYESIKQLRHGKDYHRDTTSQNGFIEYKHPALEEQDQIYMKVQYYDAWSQSTQFAEYRLRVMLSHDENPITVYFAEKYGDISQKQNQNPEIINLSWGAIKKRGSEDVILDVPDVYYSVYFASSSSIDMSSSCALHNYAMLRVTDLTDLKFQATRPRRYHHNQNQITYNVNVLATIPQLRETIPYQDTSITFYKAVDESNSRAYIYAIVFVLILLFGVGVAFLILMIRYKRTQERLYYEMQDVRNIAGIELSEIKQQDSSIMPLGLAKEEKEEEEAN